MRASGDAGVSLIELVVSMTLATILGAVTLSLFVAINSSTAATTDRAMSTAQARATLQSWTAYLRSSDGTTAGSTTNRFEWLTSRDTLFYADLFNRGTSINTVGAPTMMWLRLDSTAALVEEQFPSTATAGTSPTVCRVLTNSVTAVKLFTPYNTSGTDLTGTDLGSAPSPTAGCQPLPVTVPSQSAAPDQVAITNLQNVTSVGIDFTTTDTTGAHPLEFNALAALPTLGGSS